MKLLRLTTAYPAYLKQYYAAHPEFAIGDKSYLEHKAAFELDGFGQADFWSHALTPMGYEAWEITANAEPMQRAWARENIADWAKADLRQILLAQVRQFAPDVLWYANYDAELLQQIKSANPRIRIVLGWVGSAIPVTKVWQEMDVVLSCAPETVERLRAEGLHAEHLHHAFDPRINQRLLERSMAIEMSFIGQLVRGDQFHLERERMLERLRSRVKLAIYTPSAEVVFSRREDLKIQLQRFVYEGMTALGELGIPKPVLSKIPRLGKVLNWPLKPIAPVNLRLKPYMQPGVFGLAMFQVLKDSLLTLNVHADSSPTYASNMRLWEATGVGTCLVTDWKENMAELFKPEQEVVTYKSLAECVDKVKWLMDNPQEREKIAQAGQARTLKEHTFNKRVPELDRIIQQHL